MKTIDIVDAAEKHSHWITTTKIVWTSATIIQKVRDFVEVCDNMI